MSTTPTNLVGPTLSTGGQSATHFSPPGNHRFLFLDALRGVAALFVVVFHLPAGMTSSFSANGQLSVDFFFCLSGFVIAFSYEKRLNESISLKDFAVARWIRLYPIYAFGSVLGLCGWIIYGFANHTSQPWHSLLPLFLLSIFLWPARLSPVFNFQNFPLNGPSWSLFYEIVANLAYAVLVKLRLAGNAVLLCVVTGSLALLVKGLLNGGTLDVGPRRIGFGMGFARVAFSFFVGILLCRLYRTRGHHASRNRGYWIPTLMIAIGLMAILNAPLARMHTEAFCLVSITLFFPTMVYYGAFASLPRSFDKFSTALGELSYPLYLLHMPFALLMSVPPLLHIAVTHPSTMHAAAFCSVVLLAFGSWLVGEYVDLPLRRALTRRYNLSRLCNQKKGLSSIPAQPSPIPQNGD